MALQFPSLDCHAHISPEVTAEELRLLGDTIVFAVTRSLDEAESVIDRNDCNLVWGCGLHPGVQSALGSYDARQFRRLAPRFALIGEIGMDRRSGQLDKQADVLRSILSIVQDESVLLSLHSAGCVQEALEIIADRPHPGVILHWFLGDKTEVDSAVSLGCYFSVNAAMPDETLRNIPLERMLPETDFPVTKRRGGGNYPGDTGGVERRIAHIKGCTLDELRRRWYRNLRAVTMASGALDRIPEVLADYALMA